MYEKTKHLYGKKLSATDGFIGHVKDLYFDERTWLVRYLVADTGPWLPERQVLLPFNVFGNHSFGRSENISDLLIVNLSRKQIEQGPALEMNCPVSRHHEEAYYRYHGWPPYWQENAAANAGSIPGVDAIAAPKYAQSKQSTPLSEADLRSTKNTTGYHIQARDGPLGTVSGFTVDGRNWAIREVVVQTGHWYSRREILILPENIERISREEPLVFVNLTKQELQQTMDHDVAQANARYS